MNIQWNIHETPIFYYKYFAKLDPYHPSLVSVSVLLIYFVSGCEDKNVAPLKKKV